MKHLFILTLLFALNWGLNAQMSIIGDATPSNNFLVDHFMQQNAGNNDIWELTIFLTADDLKFRLDSDWSTNWGSSGFPSGVGVLSGANIQVNTAGVYHVTFNLVTKAYDFVFLSSTISTIQAVGDFSVSGEIKPGGVSGVMGAVLTNNGNGTMTWSTPMLMQKEDLENLIRSEVKKQLHSEEQNSKTITYKDFLFVVESASNGQSYGSTEVVAYKFDGKDYKFHSVVMPNIDSDFKDRINLTIENEHLKVTLFRVSNESEIAARTEQLFTFENGLWIK